MRNHFFGKTCVGVALGMSASFAIAAAPISSGALQELSGEPVMQSAPPGLIGQARFANQQKSQAPRMIQLDANTVAKARAKRAAMPQEEKQGVPLKIGDGIEVAQPEIDLARIPWVNLPDGRLAGQFEIAAAGAAGLRAALNFSAGHAAPADFRKMLGDVVLHVAGDDGRVFEVRGTDLPQDEIYWAPALQGSVMHIELVLPRRMQPDALKLSVPRLSYLTVSPYKATYDDGFGLSGKCENDAVCFAGTPAAISNFRNASAAVAKMVFTTKVGITAVCSGTLLNNANPTKRSLFWSAAHCIADQKVARTLQTVWSYQTTKCMGDRSTIDPAVTVLTGGARLLHRNEGFDTLLLELDSAPPPGTFYAGWNAKPASAGEEVLGIHHPAGDVKKISLGLIGSTGAEVSGRYDLTHVAWLSGVTEGGSSGSGVFTKAADGSYQLRGGLLGGLSSCNATGANRSDYYSDFSVVYPNIAAYFGHVPEKAVPASLSGQKHVE